MLARKRGSLLSIEEKRAEYNVRTDEIAVAEVVVQR